MITMLTRLSLLMLLAVGTFAAEPVPIPKTFTASIGGFFGGSYRVELHQGVLTYSEAGRGKPKPITTTITPTEAQWREFRQALDEVKVWDWKGDYFNHHVTDGTQWALEVAYADQAIKATGSNSYPDDGGKSNGKPEQTKAFGRYLKAVEKLLGGKTFE
jgi:hypothetical protein